MVSLVSWERARQTKSPKPAVHATYRFAAARVYLVRPLPRVFHARLLSIQKQKKKINIANRSTNIRKQAKKCSRVLLFKGNVRATRNVRGFFSSKQQPPEGRKCRGCSRRPCPKSTLGFWTRRGRPKQPTAAGPRPSRPPRGSTPETPPVWRGPACQRVIPPQIIRSLCVRVVR
jgi:hypothetical protein